MKKVVLVVLMLLGISGVAYAAGCSHDEQDSQALDALNKYKNDQQFDWGVGADVKVWESPNQTFSLTSENRYKFEQKEFTTFGVVDVDLWKLIKGGK